MQAFLLVGLCTAATADLGGDAGGGLAEVREALARMDERVKLLEIHGYQWKQRWATETQEWKSKWAEATAKQSAEKQRGHCDGLEAMTAQIDNLKAKTDYQDRKIDALLKNLPTEAAAVPPAALQERRLSEVSGAVDISLAGCIPGSDSGIQLLPQAGSDVRWRIMTCSTGALELVGRGVAAAGICADPAVPARSLIAHWILHR